MQKERQGRELQEQVMNTIKNTLRLSKELNKLKEEKNAKGTEKEEK